MRMPRSLWVLTNEYEPYIIGGLGTAATNVSKAYASMGVNTTVLSRGNRSRKVAVDASQRMRIARFPLRRPYYSSRTEQFRPKALGKWLDKRRWKRPDAIHIHSVQFATMAKYYRQKHRIPVIYTSHSLIASEKGSRKRIRKALRQQIQLLKISNKIAVPSRSESRQLHKRYPFSSNKTIVIPHGVTIRKRASHAPSYRLLYAGRIVPQKGIEPLLKAVAILKRKHPKVSLDLVGKGPRGYTNRLKRMSKKLGISSRVHWLGHFPPQRMQRLYAHHGAVIMPSTRESFGLVALEALASSTPLVSTRAGGLSEFVNDRVAETIPRATEASIANAIQRMWKQRKLTSRRVAAGRKLAEKYTWRRAASRYLRQFRRIEYD